MITNSDPKVAMLHVTLLPKLKVCSSAIIHKLECKFSMVRQNSPILSTLEKMSLSYSVEVHCTEGGWGQKFANR